MGTFVKIEKLELLLNKVVEFTPPDATAIKGFLQRGNNMYFIKTIDNEHTDLCEITKKDVKYIKQAEKPKLMRVSMKSWHYRLIKFVLRSNTPTPQTMQNGCPYFWLLIFSLFVSPFIALWKVVKFVFLLIPDALIWCLEKYVDGWILGMDDKSVFEYHRSQWINDTKYKMPITAKLYFKNGTSKDFLDYYLLEKYKIDGKVNSEEYWKKRDELEKKWETWRTEIENVRKKEREERQKRIDEQERKRIIYEQKQAERKAKWDTRTKPLKNGFAKMWASISNAFTYKGDWKVIIRRTKQITGAIITFILLGATYFAVNGVAFGLMSFVDLSIELWVVYAAILAIAAIVGILYVLYVFITGWAENIVNKYKGGKRIWYVEPFIYLVWYPVKYICLGVVYGFYYLIVIPIKFIFWDLLCLHFIVPVSKWIWKGLCSFGRGIANSTGVFGEYFSASYTDYCPGLEWVDTEEEEEK